MTNIDATLTLASISGTLRDHTGAVMASQYVYAQASAGTAENYDPTDVAGALLDREPAGWHLLSPPQQHTGDAANGPVPGRHAPRRRGAGGERHRCRHHAGAARCDRGLPRRDQWHRHRRGQRPTRSDATSSSSRSTRTATTTPPAPPLTAPTRIDGLPAGQYCVSVTDDGSSLAGEHYNDKSSCDTADPVTVGDTTVTGIDFALAAGGTITGTVTDPAGDPVTFGDVRAIKLGTHQSVSASIGVGGAYSIAGLSPGDYCVVARQGFADLPPRTYGGGYSCERAVTPVTVTVGAVIPGIDIRLAEGGRIAGTVTFPPGFAPGEDLGYLLISTRDEDGEQSGYVNVDLSGHYETEALAPGLYCLDSRAPSPSLLVSRRVGSTNPDYCVAGTISVTGGATTTVDYTMELGGSISGWVISPDGTPDQDPGPSLEPWAGENDRVRPDGSFFMTGVSAGTYCVSMNGFGLWLLDRTYDGVVSCDGAYTPITVVAGQNVGNVNFAHADRRAHLGDGHPHGRRRSRPGGVPPPRRVPAGDRQQHVRHRRDSRRSTPSSSARHLLRARAAAPLDGERQPGVRRHTVVCRGDAGGGARPGHGHGHRHHADPPDLLRARQPGAGARHAARRAGDRGRYERERRDHGWHRARGADRQPRRRAGRRRIGRAQRHSHEHHRTRLPRGVPVRADRTRPPATSTTPPRARPPRTP